MKQGQINPLLSLFYRLQLCLLVMLGTLSVAHTEEEPFLTSQTESSLREYESGLEAYNRGQFEMALEYWLPLAEEEYVPAMLFVGFMYQHGLGVEPDYLQSARWFMKAASLGSEDARKLLSDPFRGREVPAESYANALEWYQTASDSGSAEASYTLSQLYAKGLYGLETNIKKAVSLLQKSAQKGYIEAQYELASIYDRGVDGLPQDFSKALFWYQAAAERGYYLAQYQLGNMYYYRREAPTDYGQAITWINGQNFERAFFFLKKAAQQGYPPAQLLIARMYGNGEGVKADPVQAYIWVTLALQKLPVDSEDRQNGLFLRNEMKSTLSQNEINRAEELVAMWGPQSEQQIYNDPVSLAKQTP